MVRTISAFDGTDVGCLIDDDVDDRIRQAIDIIDDQFAEEISFRFAAINQEAGRVFSDAYLPEIFRFWYSARFIRRLYMCFIQVVARLAKDPWEGLACRGEEFVLDAVLELTRTLAEVDELTETRTAKLEHAMAQIAEVAFDDFDYQFAFDPASDGIGDPETEQGRQFGMAMPLHPRHWFKPFGKLAVHPLVQGWNEEDEAI